MSDKNIKVSGTTGEFPDGEYNKYEEAEIGISVTADKKDNIVILDFGKPPTTWIGLNPHDVYVITKLMIEKAKEIEDG